MTSARKNKKKLNQKLQQIYRELHLDDAAKKPEDATSSGVPIEVASRGSLTVVQLKEEPEKPTPKEETNISKLQRALDNLAAKLTGLKGDSKGPKGDPGKNAKETEGEIAAPSEGSNFIAKGLKEYAKSKVEGFTSIEGVAGMAGITPGEGLAGSLLGAYIVNRNEKQAKRQEEEEYISNFSNLTEAGRKLSKEEQQAKGKELYQKETQNRKALDEITKKEKTAKLFGGSLSEEDLIKKRRITAALDEIQLFKSGGVRVQDEEEDAPVKNKRAKKSEVDELEEFVDDKTNKTADGPTDNVETAKLSKEAIEYRTSLIKEVLAGIDDGIKNASQEEKATIFEKGGDPYVQGIKKGLVEELLALSEKQLMELKRISAVSSADVEDRSTDITVEKREDLQTKLQQQDITNTTSNQTNNTTQQSDKEEIVVEEGIEKIEEEQTVSSADVEDRSTDITVETREDLQTKLQQQDITNTTQQSDKEEIVVEEGIEKIEEEQTVLLKEISNKLTQTEEDKLEKKKDAIDKVDLASKIKPKDLKPGTENKPGGLMSGIMDSVMGWVGGLLGMKVLGKGGKLATTILKGAKWLPAVLGKGALATGATTIAAKEAAAAAPALAKGVTAATTTVAKGADAAAPTIAKGVVEATPAVVKGAAEVAPVIAKGVVSAAPTVAKGALEAAPVAAKGVAAVTPKAAEVAGKVAAKSAGKTLAKSLPLLGLVAGTAFAADKLSDGDVTGAALEMAAGIAGLIPGVGTAASIGLSGVSAARDLGAFDASDPKSLEKATATVSDSVKSVEKQTITSREAQIAEMKNQETIRESIKSKEAEKEKAASVATINSNNTSTVVNNTSKSGGLESTSRPIDGVNEDRYQFLQRRLVF